MNKIIIKLDQMILMKFCNNVCNSKYLLKIEPNNPTKYRVSFTIKMTIKIIITIQNLI